MELREVRKNFGSFEVVKGISLEIERGEILSLLGPSGCGKTTTLNMIAGFLPLDAGSIEMNGRVVHHIPPHRRNIGMVFQNYALFPHLSIFENVAFGVRMRKQPREEVSRRVQEALAMVRLEAARDRYPNQLSGGQQQRVALARAIVIQPEVLLLDEPLSNLDAKLRQEMRSEIVEIQKKIGITTIFVTHDQEEALAISDRIAVMNQGVVEQVGTPRDIYEHPRTAFVAEFIGETNSFEGDAVIDGNRLGVSLVPGLSVLAPRGEFANGSRVKVLVRPERICLSPPGDGAGEGRGAGRSGSTNLLPGMIERVVYLGSITRYHVRVGERTVVAAIPNRTQGWTVEPGSSVTLWWQVEDSLVAPARGEG